MKKHIIYLILLVIFISGNVYQGLNPRVETRIEIKTVEKVVTKTLTKIKIVKVIAPDGTITETTTDDSITEIDRDLFSDERTETKPLPLPLNSVYIGFNPSAFTDLELVYSRRIFGPLSAYASGTMDLTELKPKAHLGLGIQF